MKKYILPKEGKFYKANLHCHSTNSDGKLSPKKLKEIYKEKGYSIIAFTDHVFMEDYSYLCDNKFIAINGYETGTNDTKGKWINTKVYHLNFYAKNPHIKQMVAVTEGYYNWFMKDKAAEQTNKMVIKNGLWNNEYSFENINKMIQAGKDNGFLVSYNHPNWSLQNYVDYFALKNLFAVEIWNTNCVKEGYQDSEKVYEDLLRLGNKINCIATDDNHNIKPLDDINSDSFGGWIMIKPKKFTYESIINSLEKGEFYSSTGPEIYDLYIEDNYIHLNCSPVKNIILYSGGRQTVICNDISKNLITEAVINIVINPVKYLRLVLTDGNGNKAYTNAFEYVE